MKKKILVVDNDPLILEFITGLLERKGHEVVAAEDGISALNLLASFVPDIMFIDLIMPRISGEKLCRIVRSMPHLNNCYLVIVSATVAEQAPDCSKVGADAYIAKGSYSTMGDHILAAVNGADDFSGERKPIMGLDDVHPRQMTKELLSQNRHLETMLESLSEGILEVYSERVVYANSAAVSLLGFDQKKILGSYPLDLFDKFARQRVEALLKSGTDKSDEIGKDIPVEINGRRIDMKALSLKEDASTTILVMRDVTERKRAEEVRQKAHDELERRVEERTAELAETNKHLQGEIEERKRAEKALFKAHNKLEEQIKERTAKLVEANEQLQREFTERKQVEQERLQREKLQGVLETAGAVCHELNQPMQVVSLYCELLMEKVSESDPHYEDLSKIFQEIQRMSETTGKLMGITKYETTDYIEGRKILDIEKASNG